MALRLFPQVSRSLRAAPLGSRAVSRTPEQLGIFDWITRRAQPQDVPHAPPHSSATPSGQQAKVDGADETATDSAPVDAAPSSPEVSPAGVASLPSGSAEPIVDESPVASSSSSSSAPPTSSPDDAHMQPAASSPAPESTSAAATSSAAESSSSVQSSSTAESSSTAPSSSSSSSSASSEAPTPHSKSPVPLDMSLFGSSAGVKVTSAAPLPPAPTSPTLPASTSSTSSSGSVQSYSPPPKTPSPPQPTAGERWAAINETRKAQLHAQNAQAGDRYTGRTMHFRPGDVGRAVGVIQTIVRTNDIRTELVRNEYFEAKPLKRWRKKRQYWADYITVGMRENVKTVKILRDRNQLPRR